jgi:hypothetical protein
MKNGSAYCVSRPALVSRRYGTLGRLLLKHKNLENMRVTRIVRVHNGTTRFSLLLLLLSPTLLLLLTIILILLLYYYYYNYHYSYYH